MADPATAVQHAIYDALGGNAGFLVNGSPGTQVNIYDHVPQDSQYPYVTLDSEFVNNADFVNSRIDERFFYLNVWSTYKGQREVKQIMAAIDMKLHRNKLTLTTGTMVHCVVHRKRTNREPDNATYMGQVTLRIITQH